MDLAFDFLKGNIASWNPEDEIADKFEGLRMLNPMYVQRGKAGAPVALRGDNSLFEEGVSDMGYETVPGWAEGENVAGTWLYPNIINPLASPDFQMNPIQPAALIGSFRKPDWWRKQQLAPYGEGFKYHGIPDRDLRQIELPKGTQLGDINEAAQAIMENRAPRTVYQRGRWGSERVPEIHDILSQMNLEQIPVNRFSTFEPWEGKRVTSIPAQDPDRDWRDDYEMKVASEPMDLSWRLLKDRKSPEAFRHKKEYDTKYESSPERIKYREELNRERRKRGMYGDHSHRDISHTVGGGLSIEDEHSNRARHFKDRGTLRNV